MDPTKKELYTAKRPSGLDTSSPELQAAIDMLRSDIDATNWILCKVVNNTTVALHGCGSGGLDEFSAALNDDDVYYGAIRCTADGMVKFYHVFFVGLNVSALRKGKASLFKSSIFTLIDAHGEIAYATGTEEYSTESMMAQIAKLSRSTNIVV